ncbi:MAG: phenylacetate--CoA ligase [Angelakisella sp.]|nr:phenylacetate--CoA ligase [Angelakisella sp.]
MSRPYYNPIEVAPVAEIKALQTARLIHAVHHVYEHVPYYRARMDEAGVKPEDIQTLADLAKLPFTYKQDLRDTYPYGLFAVPMEDVVELHASSGTTGKQIVVGYTEKDIDIWGDITARSIVAAGGDIHSKIHVSYGYGLFTGGLGLHYGAKALGAVAIPVSSGNTKRQIQILQDFGSDILCCTPSYATFIGETIRDMGLDPKELNLSAGIFGAEPWTEDSRREIERLLDIKAYDIYGLTEIMGPGVAYECCEQGGMHVCEDHFIPEVIDPDTGAVLPEGESGELVFTCITKEAFPLLRYRTRDIGTLTREKCGCGRTLIKMSKPRGRTDDMLIIRGVNVFPSQIESVLFQTGQTSPHYLLIVDRVNNTDTLEVMVEMSPDFQFDAVRMVEEKQQEIANAIQSILGISAKISLVSPKTIERSEGKAKRVIDKRKLY